jgi:hypothetical protein
MNEPLSETGSGEKSPASAGSAWQKTAPAKPGYYWWRGDERATERYVVQVASIDGRMFVYNGPYRDDWAIHYGGEWAGPLEPPNNKLQ